MLEKVNMTHLKLATGLSSPCTKGSFLTSPCTFVCMHVCVCVHPSVCILIHVYLHAHVICACMHVCMIACMRVCECELSMHVCKYVHACMCGAYLWMCIGTWMHVWVKLCLCIGTWMHVRVSYIIKTYHSTGILPTNLGQAERGSEPFHKHQQRRRVKLGNTFSQLLWRNDRQSCGTQSHIIANGVLLHAMRQ